VTRFLPTLGAAVLLAALLEPSSISAQPAPQGPPAGVPGAQVVAAVRHDRSPALRDIPTTMVEVEGGREVQAPMPVKRGPKKAPGFRDPVLQDQFPLQSMPSTSLNFDGVDNRNAVLPPDTNGDVGPNHYVQWVNLSLAIYDKSGSLLYGPTNGNTVFSGFTGPCEDRNDGDPIVLYDEQADRWLLSQFAWPNFLKGPFYQCIAVSATPDPTGAYYRYQFSFSKMNDYPKFGVWADGYYLAINQFSNNLPAGQGVAVFEREKMLVGGSARMIYFDMVGDATLGGMLPSDRDGQPPPGGAPNLFVQFDDSPDQLQLWEFHADWVNTANSSFSRKAVLATAAFDPIMCGGSRNCIPQPGTSVKLDAISDRLMYRLQYRNLGNYEAWVVNHTVDVDGTDRAGIRWYEVRKTGGSHEIFQQGTYSPDPTNRWMASAAMDASGNIALAFNTSDSAFYPSVRYTGRLANDPAGQMTQSEADIMTGSGSQTSTHSRWGDYSMLAVDPVDGCTFWATLEYQSITGIAPWRTRIAAFKFPNCGALPPSPPSPPTTLSAAAVSTSQINLAWADNSDNETGFKIERCTGASCASFTQIATVGAGVRAYSDTGLVASTSYTYRVRAYNTAGDSGYSTTATAVTSAPANPPAPPSRLKAAIGSGSIKLTWTDNSSNETGFEIQRMTPRQTWTVEKNVTSFVDSGLTKGTTYSYTVRACNSDGCSGWSNTASARVK
jgi:hypothetical protein